ncbi:MAG TPA: hypothetical protein VH234_02960 [Candidatus Saccharimonadales bacterium]|nr:hypothetical protein [Candidatus Saccharimonadales bacterium]
MKRQDSWLQRAEAALTTRKFWWFVLALLVLQAAWIALSGRYPMAFDEDFHFGIIKLYAHHISPFWSHQPENADMFGAVARDPSYLYQYLMSFPYRLLKLVTSDQTIIVVVLRFINIGFFAAGLVLFRRLLLKTRISPALVSLSLLIFVLLPIVPLLAAQINYDNLLLPLVALALLLTFRFDTALNAKRFDVLSLLQLLVVGLLASLVKYAFLPIFVAITGFIIVRLWQKKRAIGSLWPNLKRGWQLIGRGAQIGLVIGVIVAGGLFVQRIGYNVLRYHSPAPDCSKILSVETCKEYGPWIRDYNFKLNKVTNANNPLVYTGDWFYGMWLRTFFALGGPETTFETRGPLLLPGIGAIILAASGTVAFALSAKQVMKRYNRPVLWLLLVVAITYTGFLWIDEFLAYLETGQPVAINGRYLLPVLLPLILLMVTAVAWLTRQRPRLQLGIMTVAILSLAWGGGVLTFILRSNDNWYWNNPVVRSANHTVQHVIGPLVPGYRDPVQFL